MAFTSLHFLIFLAVSLAAWWIGSKHRVARIGVLILAGYVFYASFNPFMLPVLFGVSLADFLLARAMGDGAAQDRRKTLVAVSVIVNLGLLGAFKYLNFFGRAAQSLAAMCGSTWEWSQVNLPLPVGISFFIFQSLSYTIDVYRGKEKPAGFFEYLAFMAFFPRLLAGPIVRSHQFLPALEEQPRLNRERIGLALFLLMSGFLKKMAIADFLRENIVDRVFDFPTMYQSLEVLAAVFGFTIQIYCDFSGYTDIALGLALLFGIRLPGNFEFPYLSASLQEFWRRWHMTLSFWLRDYLYISLGGNRGKSWKTYRNLFLTMVLGGLWHGAAWTFVIWGALHGAALAVERFIERLRKPVNASKEPGRVRTAVQIAFTFLFVSFAWIFFRANDVGVVIDILRQVASWTWETPNISREVVVALAVACAGMWCPPKWYAKIRGLFTRLPVPIQLIVAGLAGYMIFRVSAASLAPFVYEQF
jgi:alginate O-acetyltransferase complex protein AlgI